MRFERVGLRPWLRARAHNHPFPHGQPPPLRLKLVLNENRPPRAGPKGISTARGRRMGNHLFYGDNLSVLRNDIPDASVDLVYLDPPFNSNAS